MDITTLNREEMIRRLLDLDPLELVARITAAKNAHPEPPDHLARMQRAAIRRARSHGYALKEIADAAGTSVLRASHLAEPEAVTDWTDRRRIVSERRGCPRTRAPTPWGNPQ